MLADRDCNPFRLAQDFGVGESDNGPAERFQFGLPDKIPQDDVVPLMDTSVHLKDQSQSLAGEVGEVSADRVLPSEFVSVDLRAPKALPQAALGQASRPALTSRKGCPVASHFAT